MVSAVVDLAARRTSQAARATRRRPKCSPTAAGDVLRGERALPALLDRVRETFGITSVTLLERDADRRRSPSPDRAGPLGRVSTVPERPPAWPDDRG